MVRNGYGAKYIWYEIAILWYEMVNYGTKWLWCKIHMVRNGFWLWYEIAILWYEMVNYGKKWQWYEITCFGYVYVLLIVVLCCLFFDIRILIAPLVSSDSSYVNLTASVA